MEEQGQFHEDLRPLKRRAVSISSVDSDPLEFRGHAEGRLRTVGANNTRGSQSGDSDDGGELNDSGFGPLGAAASCKQHETELLGLTAQDDEGTPRLSPSAVPANAVSEAAVAVVTSKNASTRTCVAEVVKGTLPMDIGTHFCLADGRVVGVAASLLGPVHDPLYFISRPSASATGGESAEEKDVVEVGTALHYDLRHQRVIFCPAMQCDVDRGTDASHTNDEELPADVRPDFSDDDAEMRWKREHKRRKRADCEVDSVSSDDENPPDVDWSKLDVEYEAV